MTDLVLVGTDGSPTATRAVTAAARLAGPAGATLAVAYAYRPRPTAAQQRAWAAAPDELRWRLSIGTLAEQVVDDAVAVAVAASAGAAPVIGRAAPGSPAAVLAALAEELGADAVVVGNRDAARRFRRGIGAELARRAHCDVVIVDTAGPTRPAA